MIRIFQKNYCQLYRSTTRNYLKKKTPLYCRSISSVHSLNRNFAEQLMQHYQNKIEFSAIPQLNSFKSDIDVYQPVILSVKPNEFDKLPPKCCSCGAILQSKHEHSVGYVPSKKFEESFKDDRLSKLSCMSCFQLKSYNKTFLKQTTNGEVMNQLKHLRQHRALILYVVDIFDIEGTMFKNLQQVIGKKKRIIIVGNKVDRLPQDDPKASKQLEQMKDVLKEICYENSLDKDSNFRDICLVSAKSGFGMLSLVEKISKHRDMDMDVYIVGCTNTGKSSLYNLLVNLLSVHKNEDLPAQGIVHHLPGSTNSLIRHGISMRRLMRLQNRLKDEPWDAQREWEIDEDLENFVTQKEYLPLDKLDHNQNQTHLLENENQKTVEPYKVEIVDKDYFAQKKKEIKDNFLYDTPGILNETQIINHFNSSEINYLSPQKWIVPRSFLLKPGGCLFIGGFARIDYVDIKWPERRKDNIDEPVKSALPIYVTLMVSPNIPGHITVTETADEKYERLFVNDILKLPEGNQDRFDNFPSLKPVEYTVVGKTRNLNCCDIALHGIGWLSIAAASEARIKLLCHTPNGEGQNLRTKPLLPYTVRKKDGRGVAYQGHVNKNMYESSRQKSPQFSRLFQQQNQSVYMWKSKIREKLRVDSKQLKENKRLDRLKSGILLGKFKKLAEKEEKLRLRQTENEKRLSENV